MKKIKFSKKKIIFIRIKFDLKFNDSIIFFLKKNLFLAGAIKIQK
jgi:hypothetical protein